MTEGARSFIASSKNAKSVLFVIHEYLPQSLAFWFPAVVSILISQGKKVTVLVKEEVIGWLKIVDEVYPTDMVLTVEALKQIISIPVSSNEFGALSYEIQDKLLKITLVPDDLPADVRKLETSTIGDIYDQVVGIGLTSSHSLFETLRKAKTPLSKATYFFIGGVSPKSSLAQAIPKTTEKLEVLDDTNMQELIEIIATISNGTYTETARELIALYLYFSQSLTQAAFGHKEYSLLATLSMQGLQTDRMSKILTLPTDIANEIITALLTGARASTNENTLLLVLSKEEIQARKWTIEQLLLASYYLPKYVQVKNIAVIFGIDENSYHVVVSGSAYSVKQVAIKYGFAYTEEITGGKVTDIHGDKLQNDLYRVITEEDLQEISVTQQPITSPVREMHRDIPVSPTIPDMQNLEKIADDTTVSVEEPPRIVQPMVMQQQPLPAHSQPQASVLQTEPVVQSQGSAPPQQIPGNRQRIDFSTIAKKMKESVGN